MTRCPKCGARPAYIQEGFYHCMMCGKAWTENEIESERNPAVTDKVKKYPSGKKGVCVNCRRPAHISDRHGHCKTCANAVRGVVLDEHRAAALAAVKERLQTAIFKQAAPRLRVRAKDLKKYRNAEKTNMDKAVEYSRLPTVKQVAQTGIPAIIARAVAERDGYLAEAAKLDKAIAMLESIK